MFTNGYIAGFVFRKTATPDSQSGRREGAAGHCARPFAGSDSRDLI